MLCKKCKKNEGAFCLSCLDNLVEGSTTGLNPVESLSMALDMANVEIGAWRAKTAELQTQRNKLTKMVERLRREQQLKSYTKRIFVLEQLLHKRNIQEEKEK